MTTLFILDVEDFLPLVKVAAENPEVTVARRGPYYLLDCDGSFEIDRGATQCRNAVWFSSVAAVRRGRIARWDRDVLRVEPLPDPGGQMPATVSCVGRLDG